jgi:hypothetical protein
VILFSFNGSDMINHMTMPTGIARIAALSWSNVDSDVDSRIHERLFGLFARTFDLMR